MNSKRCWLPTFLAITVALALMLSRAEAAQAPHFNGKSGPAMVVAPPEEGGEAENHATRELVFKTINFVILVGALVYLLRKPLSDFFAQRSAEIDKGLEEGRKALAEAEARLRAVEEKLRRLDEEIAAFKATAQREMEAERQRMRDAAEGEAQKILESARARMETITRAAKLDLKHFAADEALREAEEMIRARVDSTAQSRLVARFVYGLGTKN